jgi:hypothetical protein
MELLTTLLAGVLCLSSGEIPQPDWLVTPVASAAEIREDTTGNQICLSNGIISRTILLAPNAATVGFTNERTGKTLLRGVKPEAIIVLNGKRIAVGGLQGQPDYAYLDLDWLARMTSDPAAMQFERYEVVPTRPRYPWRPKRHSDNAPWPPKGAALALHFIPSEQLAKHYPGLRVTVFYEIYDGIPVLSKWVTVRNEGEKELRLDGLDTEILAINEEQKPLFHAESDYAFNTMVTTRWVPDPDYPTQVNYECTSPILMMSGYPTGPGIVLKKGQSFDSFRTFELIHDNEDRERMGLARRRMMRVLAPQVTENPIFMHVRESTSDAVRLAVDQCAEVGFEMVILTFWSGFDIESEKPEYIARFKSDVDYAHSKGVEIGGYTLMTASRDVGRKYNCISPKTGKPGSMFGQSACLASEWSDGYFKRVLNFMDATGMDMIETDGPFHGDVCASREHKYHLGLDDSQLRQWQRCAGFYHACRERGIFINSPDYYYLAGSNKCGIGYKETNFSLPRWRQILIARQNIYDATFEKTPSMGWMFVPLVEYHGGGKEATLEPLSAHLTEYEWYLAQNFGSGVQACYRGPRLFDTDATREVVKKWVDFYKAHRPILDSDIVHVRRPDGQHIDCVMHVNPALDERALVMAYNPTEQALQDNIRLDFYYTGLTDDARISEQGKTETVCSLDRQYCVTLPVSLRPKGITWFVVSEN